MIPWMVMKMKKRKRMAFGTENSTVHVYIPLCKEYWLNEPLYLILKDDVPNSIPNPDRLPSKSAASSSSILSICQCIDVFILLKNNLRVLGRLLGTQNQSSTVTLSPRKRIKDHTPYDDRRMD